MVIDPDGTWNQDYVGEDQQQLTRADSEYRPIASNDWIIVNNVGGDAILK
jgi:hypothetical protein